MNKKREQIIDYLDEIRQYFKFLKVKTNLDFEIEINEDNNKIKNHVLDLISQKLNTIIENMFNIEHFILNKIQDNQYNLKFEFIYKSDQIVLECFDKYNSEDDLINYFVESETNINLIKDSINKQINFVISNNQYNNDYFREYLIKRANLDDYHIIKLNYNNKEREIEYKIKINNLKFSTNSNSIII